MFRDLAKDEQRALQLWSDPAGYFETRVEGSFPPISKRSWEEPGVKSADELSSWNKSRVKLVPKPIAGIKEPQPTASRAAVKCEKEAYTKKVVFEPTTNRYSRM